VVVTGSPVANPFLLPALSGVILGNRTDAQAWGMRWPNYFAGVNMGQGGGY